MKTEFEIGEKLHNRSSAVDCRYFLPKYHVTERNQGISMQLVTRFEQNRESNSHFEMR